MITIQKAAHDILIKKGAPMKSADLAREALELGLVHSNSRNKIQSLSSTIEKNIRDGTYNQPSLEFVYEGPKRLIGLPSWKKLDAATSEPATVEFRRITIPVRADLDDLLQLATQAKIAPTFEGTVSAALETGLRALQPQIRAGVLQQLSKLD
jgi:HB1, ASXL, restriction endonuclease HTH domain